MHLVFMARGNKPAQELFINGINAMMLPYKNELKDLMGNPAQFTHVQLMVQPIQLYSAVFPKECWDIVANTILGPNPKGMREGILQSSALYGLRLGMGLDSIPDYKKDLIFPICESGVERIGIGIKEDGVLNDGKTEAL